jgi:hypothetical protein
MFKPLGRSGPLLLVAACAALTGCKEQFSDDAFGVVDLSSVFDGGSPTNPAAGLPTQIAPTIGFVDGQQVEYYDFGVIPAQRDMTTGRPTAVEVRPMYFFYNPAGQPLFAAPVRDRRDGTDWMRGGKNVLNPNPKDFCAGVPADKQKTDPCTRQNDAEKLRPYPLRQRDPLVDDNRHVADYQRPIVDVTPANQGLQPYTGFWEIVEITAPGDYEPDAIKHESTLERAIASGKFQRRNTGKVIDCPILDERTVVLPGVTDRLTPRPRVELWYRRRLTFCYLVSGWETLGVAPLPGSSSDDKRQLLFANSPDQQVDTFDVAHVTVGEGVSQQSRILVPVGRGYVPTVQTVVPGSTGDPIVTRLSGNLLTRGLPKHHPNDPSGYTPVRWMWDLLVEMDYLPGGLTSVETLDPGQTMPRDVPDMVVRNIPVRGVAIPCSLPAVMTGAAKVCGRPMLNGAGAPVTDSNGVPQVDATNDPACTKSGLECNKDTCFCDAPFVGYGQSCGPGVAQCNPSGDERWEFGYTCVFAQGGFCYLGCKPTMMNTQNNMGKKPSEFRDDRCKGIPGLYCYDYNGGVCLHLCDPNVTEGNQCASQLAGAEIGDGQTCQDVGAQVCIWPDSYTPN